MVPRKMGSSCEPLSVTADLIVSPRRGEILVGGIRMCLIDINTGFRTIREALEELVGPVSRTILYNAGSGCGYTFTSKVLKEGLCKPGEPAFRFSVECYSIAGFGGFKVLQVDAAEGRGRISCREPPAFEANPFVDGREVSPHPVCDYSRGVFVGFLAAALSRKDLLGCETTCRAKGDHECSFIIGQEREIVHRELSAASEARQAEGSRIGGSQAKT